MIIEAETIFKIPLNKIKKALQILNTELNLNLDCLFLHFVSDEDVLQINKQYLNHNYYTDIITFDLRDEITKDAEIYISLERIEENAKDLSIPMLEELYRVCIHGLLHIAGYKDKSNEEKIVMRGMEERYLTSLFHVKHVPASNKKSTG